MFVPFSSLPPTSRVWIYQTSRLLNADEQSLLTMELERFISTWTAHQAGLRGSAEIRNGLFVILAVDEDHNHASGCSIDKSVHFMKELGARTGIDFFNRMTAVCKNPDGKHVFVKAQTVSQLLESGELSVDALLYNNLIQNLQDIEHSWLVPLKNSWLSSYIKQGNIPINP
ncbi:MAG: ABC transporter ATPase [Bacteroidota bacterium]